MNLDFPEMIVPFAGNIEEYNYLMQHGLDISEDKSIFFCGIVRNAGHSLERNLQVYQKCAKFFKRSEMFLYENDSSDNTLDILQKYSDSITFHSETRDDKEYREKINAGEDPLHYNRCCVLAECRNKYVDYIEENNVRDNFDYICVVDLDIKGSWSYNGFFHSIACLEYFDNAAAMTAYGIVADPAQVKTLEQASFDKYIFYDVFAYRPLGVKSVEKEMLGTYNMLSYKRGSELEEVNSNFNGLGIYKSKYFTHRYKAVQWDEKSSDPEHVYLHSKIREDGGKIYLNPNLIVSYVHHKYSE